MVSIELHRLAVGFVQSIDFVLCHIRLRVSVYSWRDSARLYRSADTTLTPPLLCGSPRTGSTNAGRFGLARRPGTKASPDDRDVSFARRSLGQRLKSGGWGAVKTPVPLPAASRCSPNNGGTRTRLIVTMSQCPLVSDASSCGSMSCRTRNKWRSRQHLRWSDTCTSAGRTDV